MLYLSRFLLWVLGFTGVGVGFSLDYNLFAFAPKLEFHMNEEAAKESYEKACREAEEGRKYEKEQQERREREEKERREQQARAEEETRRWEESARDQRERNSELFPR